MKTTIPSLLALFLLSGALLAAGPSALSNPPPECGAPEDKCGCEGGGDDGRPGDGAAVIFAGNHGDGVGNRCVKLDIGMGRTPPWSGSMRCDMRIFADDGSPGIFGVDSLRAVVGGYAFRRRGHGVLADGGTPSSVVFAYPNGESVEFAFREGEVSGRPVPGVHRDMAGRVTMVDAEGWATTADPAYYDLCPGDGTRRRFLATDVGGRLGELVSVMDARGVERDAVDMGVDVVYAPYGVRQFLTPSRLADVTPAPDWRGYDIDIYATGDAIPAKDPATGLYAIPAGDPVKRVSVRIGNGGRRAVVTVRRGGGEPQASVFDYAMGDWTLARPSGAREEKECVVADGRAAQRVETIRPRRGETLSRTESNYKWESWGFAMTNRVEGFGGATEATEWTYYASGDCKGQVKTERRQSGLLTQYAYDAENRVVSKTRSGPGMMTETTTSSYASVDPSDSVQPVDTRPRTVVRTLDGVECARTYYVYSPLTNIVERVGEPGAAYGGTNALRTVTAYYPVVDGDPCSGFVRSIRHEDGKLDLYDYALSSNLWTRTVTHLHEQSPAPVSGKTTRDITLTNARGEAIETRTEAFVEGIWHIVARETHTFNAEGKVIRSENLAGQVTTTAWDCCHKVSETKPDGSITTWDYDVEGRMVASSKLIPLDMTNVTWLTTCHEYDGLGRQTATWQTNYAAQVGTPATRTRYDALGRTVYRTDELGNTTTLEYSPDGLVVTATAANGATTVHTRNAGGETVSIAGTAVTPEFHTYGILPNGSRWMRSVQGDSAESPRFTKRFENMLGQTVREERSGFRGAVLATTHEYDGYGRLVRTIADGEPTTEYTYDILGTRVATKRITRTLGGAQSSATAEFRLSTSQSSYSIIGGDVWLVSATTNSCSDASIAPLVTTTAQQLTGLTAATPARARSTDVRGNVTEAMLSVAAQNVTTAQTLPHTANPQLSLSRYGVQMQTVSPSCVTNTFAYDALGRKVATTDGRGNTTRTEYNALGQQTAAIDALGNRTEYAYDQFGNLSSVTDPLGNATVYEYDFRGRKTYEGGATYPVRYTYDIFGNLSTLSTTRDPAANLSTFQPSSLPTASWDTTTWLYDEASGAMTNKIYADGLGPSYDYTPEGRLSRRIWARGIVTDYAYDAWGNLTNTVYSDDTPSVSLDYDAMGRQIEAHDAAGTTTFSYDAYGALTNETVVGVAGTNTIERYWDGYGRSLGYALNGERQTTIGYDSITGRIATMLAAGTDVPFLWSYLPGSDLKSSLAYPNGLTASWQYDANNQLLQVRNATPTNVVSQYDYTYDAAGRRVSCAQSGSALAQEDVISYGYNDRGELTNAVAAVDADYQYAYQYDCIGNRLWSLENKNRTEYVANCLNQYTAISNFIGGISIPDVFFPQYDDDGNQTLIKTDTGIWSVIYNGENRPVLWSNGATNIVMAYDRMGRRVVKNSQCFSYDGYLQIADNNGNAYAWDPTEPVATRPLVRQDAAYASYYFHDGNKNVTDVMAEDSSHYNYAPFGECAETYSADCNPWRFSSEFFDSISLMVYYNYRHYSVISGRWSNIDPLQNQVNDKNLASEYRNEPATCLYLRNDPVLGNDVLGLKPDKKRGPSKPFPHMPIDRESCNSEQIGKINESIGLLRTKIDRRRFTADFYKCLCESGLRRYTIDNLLTALMGGSQKEIHCAKNCPEGRSGYVCTGVKPLPPECQGNVDPKSVYICPIAFDFSMEELAKTIFHELIHVIGEDNSRHKYIYAAEKCLIFGEDKPTHDITIPEFPDPYSIECQSCK